MMSNCCSGMGFGMMLFWAIILVAVIVGAVLLVRKLSHSDQQSGSNPDVASGLDILEERFARGEIDRDEFERRRQVLGS